MTDRSRFFAGLELTLIFLLWVLTVWGAWRLSGATSWSAAGIFGLIVTVFSSAVIRRPGWKDSGFRLDNFWPALVCVGWALLVLLAPLVVAAGATGFVFPPLSGRQAAGLFASGIVQQAFFFGYLFHRWNAWVGNPVAAVVLNAFTFAFVHLPHAPLVVVTALAGLLFGLLFIRVPNVFAIGLAHGALSLVGGAILYSMGVLETTQIGPPELAPLAATVARELQPGDRVGVGPHGIGEVRQGRGVEVPIEPLGATYADDRFNREQVNLFLGSQGRVFCFITERDFRLYLDPELRRRMFLLGERYVLKRKPAPNGEFLRAFFTGAGDVPLLGPFRERVLLVSNKPSR